MCWRSPVAVFNVITPTETFVLAARDVRDRQDWYELLRSTKARFVHSDAPFRSGDDSDPTSDADTLQDIVLFGLPIISRNELQRCIDGAAFVRYATDDAGRPAAPADSGTLPYGFKVQRPLTDEWEPAFQTLVADASLSSDELSVRLAHLSGLFSDACRRSCRAVIGALPSGVDKLDGRVFRHNDIFMQAVVDYSNAGEKDIIAAHKAFGHDLKNSAAVLQSVCELRREGGAQGASVQVPLLCVVDFAGFRIRCSATDFSRLPGVDPAEAAPDAVDALAEHMNLAPHTAAGRAVQLSALSELVPFHGGGFLMSGLDTLMPLAVADEADDAALAPQRRLRSELVRRNEEPLSADAFTSLVDGSADRAAHESRVLACVERLEADDLPAFLYALESLQVLPVDSAGLVGEMHRAGINVRYIGWLAANATVPHVAMLCIVEMFARVAKYMIASDLRRVALTSPPGTDIRAQSIAAVVRIINSVCILLWFYYVC